MMARSPDADHTAALALALQASRDRYRTAPAFSLTQAGLAAALRPVLYAEPTGPDAHGFLAVGEIHDRLRRRTGLVLLHPATHSVRVSWVMGQPSAEPGAEIVPPSGEREAAGTA